MNVIEAMRAGPHARRRSRGSRRRSGTRSPASPRRSWRQAASRPRARILEGLVVTNHEDAGAWALLSQAHRRLGQPLAARFCAEVARRSPR